MPACRTLDCVSVFALTVDDAFAALAVHGGARSPPIPIRGRARSAPSARCRRAARSACRCRASALFFGDRHSAAAYEAAIERLVGLGAAIVEIDIEPFYETARLLYEGPWVAERYIAARSLIASAHEAMHPVTREIILGGARPTAVDAFAAFYRLEELRRVRDHVFRQIDALVLPTMPTVYTVEQVLADPIQLNSRLGTYTNFVNLLDLCGLALPAAMRADGAPFGVTLLAPAGGDATLASIGARVPRRYRAAARCARHRATAARAVAVAAGRRRDRARRRRRASFRHAAQRRTARARARGCCEATHHRADYRLYALAGTQAAEARACCACAEGEGAAIEVEVWALPAEAFGRFVAAVPPPLSIGTLRLADGRGVKGFLVEAEAVADARDISSFGGWRAFWRRAGLG